MHYDVIIVGGGAAGLLCAIEAGRRGRRTLVIEHNAEVGRKIVISGGGRCNFTNIRTSPDNFVSQNPHFAKSALARFTPHDFISLVKRHRIEFYEKTLGQLFCRESSRQIVEMLVKECRESKVTINTGCRVGSVTRDDRFQLETSYGPLTCDKLVIATGGLSFRKIGASDFGYRIAEKFGLALTETRPSLVALVFKGKTSYSNLAGISIDSTVYAGRHSFRENILFTHRGLSGPAILQISNYWEKDRPVIVDLLPDVDIAELIEEVRGSHKTAGNFLEQHLPKRFVDAYIDREIRHTPLGHLSRRQIKSLVESIKSWEVCFADTEGYDKAEVTLGGVSTGEISSQTMESKKIPGLYFIGEVVDVTGWLGGYNFQWAWASGYAAGQAV
jgi:predicted Rossmann fold flavoprotein